MPLAPLDPAYVNRLSEADRRQAYSDGAGHPTVPPPTGYYWAPDFTLQPVSGYPSSGLPLREGQWQMTYPESGRHPGCDLTFGSLDTGYDLMTAPDIAFGDPVVADAPLPYQDGLAFGRDYTSTATLTFEINVHSVGAGRYAANLDQVGQLKAAWDAKALRSTPGAVAQLRTRNAGRMRTVFGRPRRCAPAHSRLAKQGHTPVVADFLCQDDLFYDDTEQQLVVGLAGAPESGFTSPVVDPITTAPQVTTSGEFVVGGNREAWPVLTVNGPLTNPVLTVPGLWQVKLTASLAYDEQVVIDPRPHARTVLKNGTINLAGSLGRDTPALEDLRLPPGQHALILTGIDTFGSAQAVVSWRDAYSYL